MVENHRYASLISESIKPEQAPAPGTASPPASTDSLQIQHVGSQSVPVVTGVGPVGQTMAVLEMLARHYCSAFPSRCDRKAGPQLCWRQNTFTAYRG